MSFGLLYWVVYLLWLVLDVWGNWPDCASRRGSSKIILFILLLLLGWHCFGPPVQDSGRNY